MLLNTKSVLMDLFAEAITSGQIDTVKYIYERCQQANAIKDLDISKAIELVILNYADRIEILEYLCGFCDQMNDYDQEQCINHGIACAARDDKVKYLVTFAITIARTIARHL